MRMYRRLASIYFTQTQRRSRYGSSSCKDQQLPTNQTTRQSLKCFSNPIHGASSSSSQDEFPPMTMTLYNSLSATHQPIPLSLSSNTEEKGMIWYTCGPTVYDSPHLGHARTYVTIDIFHRLLVYLHSHSSMKSPGPIFVMNITDIDDKILTRAKDLNVSPLEITTKYEGEFWSMMEALNVKRPMVIRRVSECVEDIVRYIEGILENGMAYRIQGSVYFDVRSYESKLGNYRKLCSVSTRNDTDTNGSTDHTSHHCYTTMKQANIQKRDPRDFVLWKNLELNDDDDEDNEIRWESPWGRGRPGWHVECSAMIDGVREQFAKTHDIHVHAGGIDLKFPHHTNEIAQAEAYHYNHATHQNKEWIPHWIHTGHLHIQGKKMSKSLKNFITIRELLSSNSNETNNEAEYTAFHAPADDFRLWCLSLSGSYRSVTTYSQSRMEHAKNIRHKIIHFLIDTEHYISSNNIPSTHWTSNDIQFFQSIHQYQSLIFQSLIGSTNEKGEINGAKFLQYILALIDDCHSYLKHARQKDHAIEPIQKTVEIVRHQLTIVGFSNYTVQAGIHTNDHDTSTTNTIVGEKSLIDEMVRFRNDIRDTVLQSKREDNHKDLSNQILAYCDGTRDTLQRLGIEVFDTAIKGKHAKNTVDAKNPQWRLCPPCHESGK